MLCHQKNKDCEIYKGEWYIDAGNKNNNSAASLKCTCDRFCGWLKKPDEGQTIEQVATIFVQNQYDKFHK
jgi:hypothetical protein